MNIFFVNRDPKQCAQELPDIYCGASGKNHGGKMIVESAQLLANAYSIDALRAAPLTQKGTPRKHSYLHHPCSKWTVSSLSHWWWLLDHGFSMVEEKLFRGGPLHFTSCFLHWCVDNPPTLEDRGWQDPPQCIDDEFKSPDVVLSYQRYLTKGKTHLAFTWSIRQTPAWWRCNNGD